jgi:hypothetical protein
MAFTVESWEGNFQSFNNPVVRERARLSLERVRRTEMKAKPKQPTCVLCGQPCERWERNTDGTYTHAHCLRPEQVYPLTKRV